MKQVHFLPELIIFNQGKCFPARHSISIETMQRTTSTKCKTLSQNANTNAK